jgi:hypothetical protein
MIRQHTRPQSAMTTPDQRVNMKERDLSPTSNAMRSSFYGMSLLNADLDKKQDEKQEHDSRRQQFNDEMRHRSSVVDRLNITNILELTQQDKEILEEIKKFMKVQEDELQNEIELMQKLMLEQATQQVEDDASSQADQDQADLNLTTKDLKDYSNKLKVSEI